MYGCVRFVHLSHDELVKLISDPQYEICREYITEALSYKLNKYEYAIKDNLQYNNINYRVNYQPTAEDKALTHNIMGDVPATMADQSVLSQ